VCQFRHWEDERVGESMLRGNAKESFQSQNYNSASVMHVWTLKSCASRIQRAHLRFHDIIQVNILSWVVLCSLMWSLNPKPKKIQKHLVPSGKNSPQRRPWYQLAMIEKDLTWSHHMISHIYWYTMFLVLNSILILELKLLFPQAINTTGPMPRVYHRIFLDHFAVMELSIYRR
jgi:hypothetical protein